MPTQPLSLSASMEDYLEAIFHIVAKRKVARVKEIAEALDVRMASVTGAVQTLVDKSLVDHDKFGYVDLTDEGTAVARKIVRRHEVLTAFITDVLGLGAEMAEEVACKMEHEITPAVLERLIGFAEFLDRCPRTGEDWLTKFHASCYADRAKAKCQDCTKKCAVCIAECVDNLTVGDAGAAAIATAP